MALEFDIRIPPAIAARADLTAVDKLVWAVIRAHQGANESAWPGVRLMAVEAGLGINAVVRAIRRLEDLGLLAVERSRGRRSRYKTVFIAGTLSGQNCTRNGDSTVSETGTHCTRNGDTTVPAMETEVIHKVRKKENRPARAPEGRAGEDEPAPPEAYRKFARLGLAKIAAAAAPGA